MKLMLNVFFFFFSSRRRHTRYWRDWSSDVCSSDLQHGDFPIPGAGRPGQEHLARVLELTRAVADREAGWRQAIAGGASLPAATGIDDLLSTLRPPADGR